MTKIWFERIFLRCVLVCILITSVSIVIGQTQWELAKDKNGIKVFTSSGGSSKFKAIKVEAVLNGRLDKLIDLLLNAKSNKEWIYSTKESYLIKRISPTETLSYTETEVPWPATNRDIPINMSMQIDKKSNSIKVFAKGVPNAIPEKKGIVRLPYFNSWWDVKFDGRSKLFIKYFAEMDPGGSVPAWITNMFVARGPFETFSRLADLLK